MLTRKTPNTGIWGLISKVLTDNPLPSPQPHQLRAFVFILRTALHFPCLWG